MPEEKKQLGYYEYVPEEVPEPKKEKAARMEFECLPTAESQFETPLDTFNRLRNEVMAFREEVDLNKAEPFCHRSLGLDEMAVTIHTLGSGGVSADTTARAVVGQVEASKGTGGSISYSLYQNKSEPSPLIELDRRVDKLCQVVGPGLASRQSMFASMRELQANLELADDQKLDHVYRRTKALVTEIDTLETPEQPPAVESQQAKGAQIEKLQTVLLPLTPVAQDVPLVLSRMKTRKDTDERAARLLLRLKRLQSTHEAVNRTLLTDQEALLKVGKQMAANSKTMTTNLQLLQQRLKTL